MVMQGDITFSWYKNNKSTKTTTIQWSCQVEPLICVQLIYWHNHPEHVCLVGIYSYPCYQMTTQMNSMLGHPHAFGGPPSSGPSCNEMHPKSENRNNHHRHYILWSPDSHKTFHVFHINIWKQQFSQPELCHCLYQQQDVSLVVPIPLNKRCHQHPNHIALLPAHTYRHR